MGTARGEPVQYECIFGADAHPETGQEAGGRTLTPLTVVMDSDSELQIASADQGLISQQIQVQGTQLSSQIICPDH